MDGDRFDGLARQFATASSRRFLLKMATVKVAALASLGSISAADAARRPTPTPKPVSCPGQQIDVDGQCVCPNGMDTCGSECCPPEAQCCDNACCYGTCYGGGLCCPAGQLVCNNRCVGIGECCSSADCPPGTVCGSETPHICSCVSTVTCATAGLSCGALIDDCGRQLDCGSCQPPNTCGGGGTPGVCGCAVTTTCDGLCGEIETNCGFALQCGGCDAPETCGGGGTDGVCGCTVITSCDGQCGTVTTNCNTTLDCGDCPADCENTCGLCEICSGGSCEPAPDGAICRSGCSSGQCEGGQCRSMRTVECPPGGGVTETPCNRYQCVPVDIGVVCALVPDGDGMACPASQSCYEGTCHDGTCLETPLDCGPCGKCIGFSGGSVCVPDLDACGGDDPVAG